MKKDFSSKAWKDFRLDNLYVDNSPSLLKEVVNGSTLELRVRDDIAEININREKLRLNENQLNILINNLEFMKNKLCIFRMENNND